MRKLFAIVTVLLMLLSFATPVLADSELAITMQPQSYHYPEYSVAMYSVTAEGRNLTCTWYLEYEGNTYNLSDNTNGFEPWEAYAGENYGGFQDGNTFTYFFGGIEEELSGSQIWCVIEDGHNDVTSQKAYVTVQGNAMPPLIHDIPSEITVFRGDELDIRCVTSSSDGSQLEYIWYETSTGKLPDIQAIFPEETCDYLICDTSMVGTRYYVCYITTSNGGAAYSSVVSVTVLDCDPMPSPTIMTSFIPYAIVGQPYDVALLCDDPEAEFSVYYNPGGQNDFDNTGLSIDENNHLVGTPTKTGDYTFTVCAANAYGEDYMILTLTVTEAPEIDVPIVSDPTEEPESQETTSGGEIEDDDPEQKDDADEEDDEEDEGKKSSKKKSTGSADEFPWWGFVLIAVGAAGLGVGFTVLIMKKKK